MTNNSIGLHISEQFNLELEDLQQHVLSLGSLIEQQLALAMNAFSAGDSSLAEQAIKLSNSIHSSRKNLDQTCIQILAVRQPAAFDLRFVVTVIKIIYELEMVSELAESIAKLAIQLSNNDGKHDPYPELQQLFESVTTMLISALQAFSRITFDAIDRINSLDESIRSKFSGISRHSIALMIKDPKHITRTLDILRVARALERIGDHAFHVHEEIVYMVNGEA